MNLRNLLSEFLGTFALLVVGIGSIATNQIQLPVEGKIGLLGIALAHGITIAVMASALGPISGGHFNPAVTLGAWVGGRIAPMAAIAYMVAQVLGGLAGTLLAGQIYDPVSLDAIDLGLPVLDAASGPIRGLLAEATFTFFLVAVVFGTAFFRWAPKVGGLYIGLTLTLAGLAIGPITGASINPARWLGPALVEGNFADAAVYLAGPAIGGILAALIFGFILEKRDEAAGIEPSDEAPDPAGAGL